MNVLRVRSALGLVVALGVSLTACSDDATDLDGFGTVDISFDHAVAAAAVQMGQMSYQNAAGNDYSVTKLQYIVSDFMISGDNGANAFSASVNHYRDISDSGTRTLTLTDVPAGVYTTLSFRFGIEGSKNTSGAFPELASMDWPAMMGGGYHYMRFEGDYGAGGANAFTTHLGPTAGNDRSFVVTLDLGAQGFTIDNGDRGEVSVTMDLNQWYEAPNVYDLADYGPIMGNQGAQQTLHENGKPDGSGAGGVFEIR